MAISELAREQGREYSLEQFSSKHNLGDKKITSEASWEKHLDWATNGFKGGTDFDLALRGVMQNAKELYDKGVRGIDALFVSDDECRLSDTIIKEWLEFKEEYDVRLLYIAIGDDDGSGMYDLSDKVLAFHKLDMEASDVVATALGKWLAD